MVFPALPPLESRKAKLDRSILSISGWRKVFADDGHDDSLSPALCAEDVAWVACAARVLGKWFREQGATRIALGRDSRPTGGAIEALLLRGLLSSGVDVALVGLTAVPQFLAFVGRGDDIGGFVYVSASHNPPGHNGLKMGLGDGSVLAAGHAANLAELFRAAYLSDVATEGHLAACKALPEEAFQKAAALQAEHALVAEKRYFALAFAVASATEDAARQSAFLARLDASLRAARPVLACDFNGSARLNAIDRAVLGQFGVELASFGDALGVFPHRIVPEGESLEPLRRFMEEAQRRDASRSPILGWVPDCDGDRGNLVLSVQEEGGGLQAVVPDAQSTFYLAVLSELAFLAWSGEAPRKLAVVANDPTSLRCDELCRAFRAELFRAEVGEANVLALAMQKQAEGFHVRILGEGSNGGNITLPGTVRDPLSTVFSMLKLLFLVDGRGKSLWEGAAKALGIALPFSAPAPRRLAALLACASRYATTGAFDASALVRLKCPDQALLKREYEARFARAWFERADDFGSRFGIASYRILNYEGTKTLPGPGCRTGREDGGWKAEFLDADGRPAAFTWMRGSRTEPVFRVMADVRGDRAFEEELLSWHRELLAEADAAACGRA